MSTYKTVLGDTWDIIAFNIYGKEKYAKELIESNLEHVETVIFSAGIILIIPDIDTESDTSSLPPWKVGNTSEST
ncbi:tail protein X [Clostridium sp.]|uniref:tail protein X n=1 Tax=Clostridium sp. TaxID=1506 RepID=UPI00262FEE6E|nr:tail protein X [Clostridium sp.]